MERTGFEHVGGRGGAHVWIADLPSWDTPKDTIVSIGSCWFVLVQDLGKGLGMIRDHYAARLCSATRTTTYAIMTLRQIVCCKATDGTLVCTCPEPLFGDSPPTDSAIDLLLWASDKPPKPSRLNRLPVEIQDRILLEAATSPVAAGKLGIELGLGSPFTWLDGRLKINLEEIRRHRTQSSPIESQIFVNGRMSGLSYKGDRPPKVFRVDFSSVPAPPRPNPFLSVIANKSL
ncbi:hypothetical protein FBEOM_9377 [Fusarium beomiforme]|uniref:Uncharacterized protein n=1 Tax=Fusarium beomiforme TaxID=44412 RepID=A0A9P5DTL5_9HYPO|nr:hypothetical protein FBEOM_9377 [Fusarium beomiforme]